MGREFKTHVIRVNFVYTRLKSFPLVLVVDKYRWNCRRWNRRLRVNGVVDSPGNRRHRESMQSHIWTWKKIEPFFWRDLQTRRRKPFADICPMSVALNDVNVRTIFVYEIMLYKFIWPAPFVVLHYDVIASYIPAGWRWRNPVKT